MYNFISKYQKNPFKLFFPIGFAMAILGVLPWAFLLAHWQQYPLLYHRMVMIGGFLTAFVIGFLMTALPRFTQTHFATTKEMGISIVMLFGTFVSAVMQNESLFYTFLFCNHLNIFVFAIRRFLKRKVNPPSSFLFVGLGFIIWLVSDLYLFLYSVSIVDDVLWYLLFKNLWIEGAILSLILGVGGRLITGILGWSDIVQKQRDLYERPLPYIKVIPLDLFIAVLVLLSSFFIESFFNMQLGLILRGIVVCFFGIRFWKVYKLPEIKSRLTYGIWAAVWCLIIGYVVRALWISGGTHALHIILIGGFGLLTIIIATRVTLAHSSAGTSIEKTSKILSFIIFVMLSAAFTRAIAIIWPKIYLDHLAYAAILWVVAMISWLLGFLKILLENRE